MRIAKGSAGLLLIGITIFVLVASSACIPTPWNTLRFTSADRSYSYWGLPGVLTAANGAAGGDTEGQVVRRAVVEPDVIYRDDKWLYILNQFRGLSIVDLERNLIVKNLPTFGFPRDLYIQNGRAYVLVSHANRYEVNGNKISFTIGSRLYIADVEQPENAQILDSIDLQGDLVDSRLVGDVLYAVGAQVDWYYGYPVDGGVVSSGKVVKARTGGTWVTSVNCADPGNIYVADEVDFDGTGTEIHATPDAVFVASPNWSTQGTTITFVDISDPVGAMAVRGSVEIRGQVNDRYKLDYWNGVLRIVSTLWNNGRQTLITTVDCADPDHLLPLAVEEFERANGETLFATRFDGPRAYVVTYFMVDPLFILDLSDPAAPAQVGELEVPGWSTFIEPLGDRLLALGVDDTNGDRRVCVSLFDVTDPANPSLADRVTFGDSWNWSSAYEDVKAMAIFPETVVVPFAGWEYAYGEGFNRIQFISYTENDLTRRGYVDVQGTVLRTFYYDGYYYCVTTEQLVKIDASNMDSPAVIDHLVLAENVSDYQEITPGLGAEIVTQREQNRTLIRLVTQTKSAIGEVSLNVVDLVDTFVYGSYLVLVAQEYEPDFRYRVFLINCEQAAAPEVEADIVVDVDPYIPWWYYFDGPVVLGGEADGAPPALGIRDTKMIYPWRVTFRGAAYLAGDNLVLRCSAPAYDMVVGSSVAPAQGLAVVNLATREWTRTIGLGFDEVVFVDTAGNYVFVSSKTSLGMSLGQPVCAYFITRIDPATGTAGQTANVPGVFCQYDAANQVLTLKDDQWSSFLTYDCILRTVSWDGTSGNVSPIDSQDIPEGVNQMVCRGNRIYMDTYSTGGIKLVVVNQSPSGQLTLGAGTVFTNQWGFLIDAHATAAYVSVGDGAIARYDCRSSAPQYTHLIEVMGAPLRIRFGSSKAFAPNGYFGTTQLPL